MIYIFWGGDFLVHFTYSIVLCLLSGGLLDLAKKVNTVMKLPITPNIKETESKVGKYIIFNAYCEKAKKQTSHEKYYYASVNILFIYYYEHRNKILRLNFG